MRDGVFAKLYINDIHEGLVADMGAELFTTLAVIATFINVKGQAFPSQELLAFRMGVSRSTANIRVNKLLAYRWKGNPLITSEKIRSDNGSFAHTLYTITEFAPFAIFEDLTLRDSAMLGLPNTVKPNTN